MFIPKQSFAKTKAGSDFLSEPALVAFGSTTGNRTPVSAVRGRRLNRLTMMPFSFTVQLLYHIVRDFAMIFR